METLDALSSVVPQVYFDIIARVIPGSVTIGICLFGNTNITKSFYEMDGFVQIIILLGAGYVIGMLLTAISSSVLGLSMALVTKWIPSISLLSPSRIYAHVDTIYSKNKVQGEILLKMLAETFLCLNLLTGFAVISILGTIKGVFDISMLLSFHKIHVSILIVLAIAVVQRLWAFTIRIKGISKLIEN